MANATSIDDIAKALATYFPKVTGTVTSVDAYAVVIQSEKETGLSAGVLLSAYQMGEPFYHPVTGAELGHFEEEIGLLEVVNIEHGLIRTKVIKSESSIMSGTLVRLTAARIPIEITGGTAEGGQFLIHELKLALEATGRFTVSSSEGNLYLITLTANPSPASVKVQMKNIKTGKIVSDIESMLQASSDSDTIFESLQYQLFKKQQQGIPAK